MVIEAQAAVVARCFSGRLPFPTTAQAKQWNGDARSTSPDRMVSTNNLLDDPQYINHLREWTLLAKPAGQDHEKFPPFCCCCMVNANGISSTVQAAYKAKGSKRSNYKTYASLGFHVEMPCYEAGA
jgi:hypothetical protein